MAEQTEFSALLDKLGWTEAKAAVELNRTIGSVHNCAVGHHKPHDHTILYMQLLVENRELKSRLKRRKD